MRCPTITQEALGLTQSPGSEPQKGTRRWWKWQPLERWDSQSFRAADLNRRERLAAVQVCAAYFAQPSSQLTQASIKAQWQA